METGEQIVGTKQEPAIIVIEAIEETQREKEVRDVANKARVQALERL